MYYYFTFILKNSYYILSTIIPLVPEVFSQKGANWLEANFNNLVCKKYSFLKVFSIYNQLTQNATGYIIVT